jgi:hypothetical protein
LRHTSPASASGKNTNKGALTWLPQPTPADEADIPVGVNSCGNIVAWCVNADSVLNSGYVWNRTLTCDQSGVLAP